MPARPQQGAPQTHRRYGLGHKHETEAAGYRVELLIADVRLELVVDDAKFDVVHAVFARRVLGAVDHRGHEVAPGDEAARSDEPRYGKSRIPAAAGHVQHTISLADAGQFDQACSKRRRGSAERLAIFNPARSRRAPYSPLLRPHVIRCLAFGFLTHTAISRRYRDGTFCKRLLLRHK